MATDKENDPLGEVLFEVYGAGMQCKVTAVDPRTGLEATVIVPAYYTEYSMKMAARRKLVYVVRKHLAEKGPRR